MSSKTEARLFEIGVLVLSILIVLLVSTYVTSWKLNSGLSPQNSPPDGPKDDIQKAPAINNHASQSTKKTLTRISNFLKNHNIDTNHIIEVARVGPDRRGRPQFRVDLRDIPFQRADNLLHSLDINNRYGVKAFAVEREISGMETFRVVYRIAVTSR